DPGARDELPYLLLALAAERALEQVAAVTDACHLIALLYARSRRATDRTSSCPMFGPTARRVARSAINDDVLGRHCSEYAAEASYVTPCRGRSSWSARGR